MGQRKPTDMLNTQHDVWHLAPFGLNNLCCECVRALKLGLGHLQLSNDLMACVHAYVLLLHPVGPHSSSTHLSARPMWVNTSCLECRSIGVLDKKDTDEGSKQEREEEEHKQGIAKHDVFGMNIKAKDVGDEGDVRAMDTSMQVPHMVHRTALHCNACGIAFLCACYCCSIYVTRHCSMRGSKACIHHS